MNIYFICYPHGPAEKAGYEHQIIAIAEGLKEQGITPKGNVNYWLNSTKKDDYLIKKHQTNDLNDFDAVVFSATSINYQNENLLPKSLFSKNRKYKLIMIDAADGFITPGFDNKFRDVDFILKSHYCSKYNYPSNFIPWQFGLTNRIIQYATDKQIPFNDRNKSILSNFRVGHELRDIIEDISQKYFYPICSKNSDTDDFDKKSLSAIDSLFWKQTGRRHYPKYYERLSQSMISNAVGGNVQKSISNGKGLHYRILRKADQILNIFSYDRVFQYDSWRFWESLISGSCTLHVDLEKYGARLPEMPVNGLHYIGIDLDNPIKALKILKNKKQLQTISENGKNWVLDHYSPLAVSNRFLKLIKN